MGLISTLYRNKFVCRYDREIGVPYHSHFDFKGLKQEEYHFINSRGVDIRYFYYYYENYNQDKLILFLHGLGPGHCCYLAEIEQMAKRGYKVLTLDYTGCDYSGGERLESVNMPTKDTMELLDLLKIKQPIVLMGHSMGAYTALNLIHIRDDIDQAVILSGFLSIPIEIKALLKKNFFVRRILKYEKKTIPEYYDLNNLEFLKNTSKKLFFIHSDNDVMVPISTSFEKVEELNNPNITCLKVTGRKHNPNYTDAATKYMDEVFGTYNYLLKKKKIITKQQRIDYFKDVSLDRLVEQDEKIFDQIDEFIKTK